MKPSFLPTTIWGCLGIEALLAAGYEISAIFTHTDNPGEKPFIVP